MSIARPRLVWRRCIAFALAVGAGVATACGSSSATQPPMGSPTNPNPRLVDTLAFNATADSIWLIAVGDIATYLINRQVEESGIPLAIRPRLLTDTVTISDTIGGPPIDTDLRTPSYLTFDGSDNLWMSVTGSQGDGSIIRYTRSQISQNGVFPPSLTLTGTRTPLGLRFDHQGRLWVVDSAASALYSYTSLQVSTGGGPPADTVSLAGVTTGGVTWAPVDLAIDAGGDVWVSAVPRNPPPIGNVPPFIVVEFTAAAVQSSGTPAPTLTLTGLHSTGAGPAMVFDSTGDLWTANPDMATATEFTAASLIPGSNPAPAVTLSGAAFSGAGDIAIDANGILYFGGSAFGGTGSGIFALPASALKSSGSPTPTLSYTPRYGVTHFTIK